MTSPAITVRPDDSAQHVAETLARYRISATPVVNEAGALVGMVSEYDLLAKAGGDAREVMTTAVISVSTDCAVDDIRHLLIERRIRRVPVLQEGHLVGIVSRRDVMATMATEWVCQVCGEPVRGEHPPSICPRCRATSEQFELQEQPPGT
ncbi:CBS domain-containing protein [Mycobacterium sp.]|uniref:CBS domain-containing protein n=1 Tax=Mycobacterium sp. TaxID=1785 RepID=UPI003D6B81E7